MFFSSFWTTVVKRGWTRTREKPRALPLLSRPPCWESFERHDRLKEKKYRVPALTPTYWSWSWIHVLAFCGRCSGCYRRTHHDDFNHTKSSERWRWEERAERRWGRMRERKLAFRYTVRLKERGFVVDNLLLIEWGLTPECYSWNYPISQSGVSCTMHNIN